AQPRLEEEQPQPAKTSESKQATSQTEPSKTAGRQTVRVDVLGDPLPQEALARLGTARLRTGRHYRFLPDARRFMQSRTDGGLQISEVPTGKPLVRIRATDVSERTDIIGSTVGFTADAKYLAAVCWEGRTGIWETSTGRLVR